MSNLARTRGAGDSDLGASCGTTLSEPLGSSVVCVAAEDEMGFCIVIVCVAVDAEWPGGGCICSDWESIGRRGRRGGDGGRESSLSSFGPLPGGGDRGGSGPTPPGGMPPGDPPPGGLPPGGGGAGPPCGPPPPPSGQKVLFDALGFLCHIGVARKRLPILLVTSSSDMGSSFPVLFWPITISQTARAVTAARTISP